MSIAEMFVVGRRAFDRKEGRNISMVRNYATGRSKTRKNFGDGAGTSIKNPASPRLAILGIVVTVIGVECTRRFSSCLPPETRPSTSASRPSPKREGKGESKDKEAKHEGKGRSEGEGRSANSTATRTPPSRSKWFSASSASPRFNPPRTPRLRIEFNLYGTVSAKEQKEFMTALEENQHRFRDQVLVIVRSAEITDLTDAGLGTHQTQNHGKDQPHDRQSHVALGHFQRLFVYRTVRHK